MGRLQTLIAAMISGNFQISIGMEITNDDLTTSHQS